jgi:tRNA (cmo5U34)-methyltransferase
VPIRGPYLKPIDIGDLVARVTFHEGYIDDAPEGQFDGATCPLTLHFLPWDERIRTLKEVHRRLKPGGRLVTVHHSFPNDDAGKDKWFGRNAALVSISGIDPINVAGNIKIMKEKLPVLSPDQDVAVLEEAGFGDVELFYAAFTFKGWVSERC